MIEIKRRYSNETIFACEASAMKQAVEEAVKSGANLRGANLRGANLSGADLSGVNLSYADLRRTDLSGADLSGVNLSYSDLRRTDLRYADLRGVKIRNEIMICRVPIQIYAITYHITIWDAHMQIGCEFHALADWWSYGDRHILKMDGKRALDWWRNWKTPLMEICEADGRK